MLPILPRNVPPRKRSSATTHVTCANTAQGNYVGARRQGSRARSGSVPSERGGGSRMGLRWNRAAIWPASGVWRAFIIDEGVVRYLYLDGKQHFGRYYWSALHGGLSQGVRELMASVIYSAGSVVEHCDGYNRLNEANQQCLLESYSYTPLQCASHRALARIHTSLTPSPTLCTSEIRTL